MVEFWILKSLPTHILLTLLCISCGFTSCMSPWYFITVEDSLLASTTTYTWTWATLSNYSSYFPPSTQPYEGTAPHLYISFLSSFAISAGATGLVLITLCLSLSLFHPAVDYETKETVNCAVIGILVFCFLCFLASAVQMVVTLPVAFAADIDPLTPTLNCHQEPSICTNFIAYISIADLRWYWGPYFGWVLSITAAALCLASVGSATFVLLERKAMGNPNNRRVNDSDQEPRSGSGYYSALTTNLDTTGEF